MKIQIMLAVIAAISAVAVSGENTALLKSPRFIEEHPEIVRQVMPSKPESKLNVAKTPRNIEEFPQLVRTGVVKQSRLPLEANKGWASTPRAREENHALALAIPGNVSAICNCTVAAR